MEKWILNDQIVNILKVGLSGFAFLVLLLSYTLLKTEQKRENRARANVLRSIHRFTNISILFVLIVGGFSILELFFEPNTSSVTNSNCEEAIVRMRLLSKSPNQNKESLVLLIENLSENCISENKKK